MNVSGIVYAGPLGMDLPDYLTPRSAEIKESSCGPSCHLVAIEDTADRISIINTHDILDNG